jgi:hypothetical protein
MRRALVLALVLPVGWLSACTSIDNVWQRATGSGVERTFEAPIARVKPAFISTLSQMGMPISAMELRGRNEVLRARKGGRSADIELEPLNAKSTRVRVMGSDDATASEIMRETEKRLGAG